MEGGSTGVERRESGAARLALLVNAESGPTVDPSAITAGLARTGATVRRFSLYDTAACLAWEPQRLVLAGGDGAIARVATLASRARIPLAVLPSGTANDFARALSIPTEPEAAYRLAAGGNRLRWLDLGWMGEWPFVNVASAGLAVSAARHAAPWKRLIGTVAYALGAVRAGFTAPAIECRLLCDGSEVFDGKAWQVIVSNTGAFGAGSRIEQADPGDRRLDATVIEAGSRARLALHTYGLRSGDAARSRGVLHARGRRIDVRVAPDIAYNVDGEIVRAGSACFSIQPRAFQLVVG